MGDLSKGPEKAAAEVRTGHLLRVGSYMDIAVISMWGGSPRVPVLLGMVAAGLRGEGPGGGDEDLLARLRPIVEEARGFYDADDFPAAMSRMRVANDLLDLRIVALAGARNGG